MFGSDRNAAGLNSTCCWALAVLGHPLRGHRDMRDGVLDTRSDGATIGHGAADNGNPLLAGTLAVEISTRYRLDGVGAARALLGDHWLVGKQTPALP